ncbi:tigger transposable element-derived protein 4-like [Ornithodoros turicata]|uniref:tigger transposable element-derived protein 4-like n=1 Tax=Ornithodoros turicata TaxID=34597 RepID=UPI00313A3087
MTGTEKLPLFVIRKRSKPRCFKNIPTLPTEYTAHKKARMTADLFKQWLKTWDRKLELRNRKVLLIVDNCTAHKMDVELRAIGLAFLPANTTAALQPMDQGVIKNTKTFYRRHMLERLILCGPSNTVTLLLVLHMLAHARDQVVPSTIADCFCHCGFIAPSCSTARYTCLQELTDDVFYEENIPANIHEALQGVRFTVYVDADGAAAVCGVRSDEDIVAEVSGRQERDEENEDSEEVEETTVRPSSSQVLEALNVARQFFSHEEGQEDALHHLRVLEHKLMVFSFRVQKQQTITDFFHQ